MLTLQYDEGVMTCDDTGSKCPSALTFSQLYSFMALVLNINLFFNVDMNVYVTMVLFNPHQALIHSTF